METVNLSSNLKQLISEKYDVETIDTVQNNARKLLSVQYSSPYEFMIDLDKDLYFDFFNYINSDSFISELITEISDLILKKSNDETKYLDLLIKYYDKIFKSNIVKLYFEANLFKKLCEYLLISKLQELNSLEKRQKFLELINKNDKPVIYYYTNVILDIDSNYDLITLENYASDDISNNIALDMALQIPPEDCLTQVPFTKDIYSKYYSVDLRYNKDTDIGKIFYLLEPTENIPVILYKSLVKVYKYYDYNSNDYIPPTTDEIILFYIKKGSNSVKNYKMTINSDFVLEYTIIPSQVDKNKDLDIGDIMFDSFKQSFKNSDLTLVQKDFYTKGIQKKSDKSYDIYLLKFTILNSHLLIGQNENPDDEPSEMYYQLLDVGKTIELAESTNMTLNKFKAYVYTPFNEKILVEFSEDIDELSIKFKIVKGRRTKYKKEQLSGDNDDDKVDWVIDRYIKELYEPFYELILENYSTIFTIYTEKDKRKTQRSDKLINMFPSILREDKGFSRGQFYDKDFNKEKVYAPRQWSRVCSSASDVDGIKYDSNINISAILKSQDSKIAYMLHETGDIFYSKKESNKYIYPRENTINIESGFLIPCCCDDIDTAIKYALPFVKDDLKSCLDDLPFTEDNAYLQDIIDKLKKKYPSLSDGNSLVNLPDKKSSPILEDYIKEQLGVKKYYIIRKYTPKMLVGKKIPTEGAREKQASFNQSNYLPYQISNLISKEYTNNVTDKSYTSDDIMREGCVVKELTRSTVRSSFLDCLNKAFNVKLTLYSILSEQNIHVHKQSFYDVDLMKDFSIDKDNPNGLKYIDPYLFIPLFENVFECRIFVFRTDKLEKTDGNIYDQHTMVIPRYYKNLYRNINPEWNTKCVMIYEHCGNIATDYYSCELITIRKNPTEKLFYILNDNFVKKLLDYQNKVSSSYCINREGVLLSERNTKDISLDWTEDKFTLGGQTIINQYIDDYGKSSIIQLNENGWVSIVPPLEPINNVNVVDYQNIGGDKSCSNKTIGKHWVINSIDNRESIMEKYKNMKKKSCIYKCLYGKSSDYIVEGDDNDTFNYLDSPPPKSITVDSEVMKGLLYASKLEDKKAEYFSDINNYDEGEVFIKSEKTSKMDNCIEWVKHFIGETEFNVSLKLIRDNLLSYKISEKLRQDENYDKRWIFIYNIGIYLVFKKLVEQNYINGLDESEENAKQAYDGIMGSNSIGKLMTVYVFEGLNDEIQEIVSNLNVDDIENLKLVINQITPGPEYPGIIESVIGKLVLTKKEIEQMLEIKDELEDYIIKLSTYDLILDIKYKETGKKELSTLNKKVKTELNKILKLQLKLIKKYNEYIKNLQKTRKENDNKIVRFINLCMQHMKIQKGLQLNIKSITQTKLFESNKLEIKIYELLNAIQLYLINKVGCIPDSTYFINKVECSMHKDKYIIDSEPTIGKSNFVSFKDKYTPNMDRVFLNQPVSNNDEDKALKQCVSWYENNYLDNMDFDYKYDKYDKYKIGIDVNSDMLNGQEIKEEYNGDEKLLCYYNENTGTNECSRYTGSILPI